VAGNNRILFVGVQTGATSLSSVTYNGAALTLVDSYHENYNNSYVFLYYMVAPDTGSHNVVVTTASPAYTHVTAASYTGASQTGVPDTKDKSTGQAQNYSQSVTAADNSWVVMMAINGNGRAVGAGTDSTLRGTTLFGGGVFLDSNGPVTPAASRTLIANGTYSSDYWATVIASFKPY
jgi:hypothetical protein